VYVRPLLGISDALYLGVFERRASRISFSNLLELASNEKKYKDFKALDHPVEVIAKKHRENGMMRGEKLNGTR
jgi:hypothetical protein